MGFDKLKRAGQIIMLLAALSSPTVAPAATPQTNASFSQVRVLYERATDASDDAKQNVVRQLRISVTAAVTRLEHDIPEDIAAGNIEVAIRYLASVESVLESMDKEFGGFDRDLKRVKRLIVIIREASATQEADVAPDAKLVGVYQYGRSVVVAVRGKNLVASSRVRAALGNTARARIAQKFGGGNGVVSNSGILEVKMIGKDMIVVLEWSGTVSSGKRIIHAADVALDLPAYPGINKL
ncbi:MAG: hypothetical protein WC595_01100 [Candidatus Nanoarchaeia archaeon]